MKLHWRDRLMLAAAAVAIIGVVGLYAYASSLQARSVAISSIGGDDVGSLVRVEGLLKDVRASSGGSLQMKVMDPEDYDAIRVFIPRDVVDALDDPAEWVPGATVSVAGEVQEYRGDVELYVGSARDIRLLSPAASEMMEVDVLARNPQAFEGMTVSVQGILLDTEVVTDWKRYYVTDATASLWAYVTKTVAEGDSMDVFGVLQHNEARDRWEVKVAGPADGVFQSPATVPAGYAEVTVEQILSDPPAYEEAGVAIRGANVTRGELIGTRFAILDEGEDDTYSIEGIIFGWDFDADPRGIRAGDLVSFVGVFEYYEEGARWQIHSDDFTLTP